MLIDDALADPQADGTVGRASLTTAQVAERVRCGSGRERLRPSSDD